MSWDHPNIAKCASRWKLEPSSALWTSAGVQNIDFQFLAVKVFQTALKRLWSKFPVLIFIIDALRRVWSQSFLRLATVVPANFNDDFFPLISLFYPQTLDCCQRKSQCLTFLDALCTKGYKVNLSEPGYHSSSPSRKNVTRFQCWQISPCELHYEKVLHNCIARVLHIADWKFHWFLFWCYAKIRKILKKSCSGTLL